MKKAVIILVAILLAVFFCCELRAAAVQKSIIPAEAVWMIHFDLEKFTSTQIGDHLLRKEGSSGLNKKNAQFRKKYQIDLLKDIHGITVFGFGADEDQIVACLRGNFNQKHLLKLLSEESSHREIPHGKYTIHNWGDDEYGVFADEHLALMGSDEDALKLTLDVIENKALLRKMAVRRPALIPSLSAALVVLGILGGILFFTHPRSQDTNPLGQLSALVKAASPEDMLSRIESPLETEYEELKRTLDSTTRFLLSSLDFRLGQ